MKTSGEKVLERLKLTSWTIVPLAQANVSSRETDQPDCNGTFWHVAAGAASH